MSKKTVDYYVRPCSSFGYYRGEVVFGQDLSAGGYGPDDGGGIGKFSQGEGPIPTTGIDIPLPAIIAVIVLVGFIFTFLCQNGE